MLQQLFPEGLTLFKFVEIRHQDRIFFAESQILYEEIHLAGNNESSNHKQLDDRELKSTSIR